MQQTYVPLVFTYVSFLWNKSPLDTDLVLDLLHDGVRLLFDSKLQRLKVSNTQEKGQKSSLKVLCLNPR